MAYPQEKIELSQIRFTAASEASPFGLLCHQAVVASVLSLAVLTTLIPSRTEALTLGDLTAFFRPKAEASVSQTKSQSVQTMPVLEASMNPNPAKGGADITIVDNEAVKAEEGPAGSIAEIDKPKNSEISIYVVREGDTLSQIAAMFNVTVNTIIWANNLSRSGGIKPGQVLTILPVPGVRHTVKKGDTLSSLAKQYHADAEEIADYNGIKGGLVVGNEIIIPDGEVVAPPAPKNKAASVIASSGSASYAGYYMRPLVGGTRTQGVHGYNGVDLAAPVGTPLLASAAGETIVSKEGGWNGGYGSYVVIRHDNGTQTLYAHASSVIVGLGQHVVQGQVIGYVGATGKATGPHVHFEIRGGPRNPF